MMPPYKAGLTVGARRRSEGKAGIEKLALAVARTAEHKLWLLLPIAVLYIAVAVLPFAVMVRESFAAGWNEYAKVLANPLLLPTVENTVVISILTAVVSVATGYVLAVALWQNGPRVRIFLLIFILLPFWTGVLVKNFAWEELLQHSGPINNLVQAWGLSAGPLPLLHNRFAVIVGMVHYALPYAIFPIFATMIAIDDRLSRAARSLGASSLRVFWHITLPLTLPGVYASALLVFVIATGFFITPVILGGPADMMVSNLINYYVHEIVDLNGAAALGVLFTAAVSLLILIYQRLPKEGQHGAT